MSSQPEDSFSDSHLESPVYRQRLLRKLNTLIAVLEVAIAKVRRSLAGPDPDVERLLRIHKNLKNTLDVCRRARRALERREKLPEDLPASLQDTAVSQSLALPDPEDADGAADGRGLHVEMSSIEEARKFRELGPIDSEMVRSCDLDDLCSQLQDL